MRQLLIISILFLAFLLSCSSNKNKEVLAEVGGHKILLSEFTNRYDKFLDASGIKDNIVTRRNVLNDMVNETLLFNYDNNSKIFNSKDYIVEKERLKKQAVLAYLKDREVYAKISADDNELRTVFKRSNERLAVRHLFAKTKEEADNLFELLKAGVGFEQLAKQVFSDSTLKNNGGYLGYFSWGDMDPAFEEAAFKLKIGEISHPVQTEYGYSIIKLEDRVIKPILTEYEFNKNKMQITRALKIYKKRPSEKAYISKVVNFAQINFNDQNVKTLYNELSGGAKIKSGSESVQNIICAEYNGKSFNLESLKNRINNLPVYHREKITSADKLKTVIKGFILQDALLKIAYEKEYDKVKAVIDTYERNQLNMFMQFKKAEITQNAEIDDSLVYNFYKNHLDFFSRHNEVKIQEIILDSKELADEVYSRLKNGEDFGKLAEKYSKRKISAQNKGILEFAPLSKFGILKNKFWTAELNKILVPIMVDSRWGIFKVLGKKKSTPFKFEEVKNEAALAAKYFERQNLFNDYVNRLRNSIHVKMNDDLLSSYKQRANT